MDKKKTGLFLSGDSLSEYVYNKLAKDGDIVSFAFEDIPFAESSRFRFGDVAGIMALLKKEKVGRLVMIGRIDPSSLFKGEIQDSGKSFLKGQAGWQGEALLASAASLLEKEGVRVLPLTQVLGELLAESRVYTAEKPDRNQLCDIDTGISLINSLSCYRAGQAAALKNGMVIAVEGIEGTDSMIKRAGGYCKGFTVVKLAGRGKDERFDLPVIGPGTAEAMKRAGGKVLAAEAGKTVIFEKEKTVSLCEENDIILLGTPAKS